MPYHQGLLSQRPQPDDLGGLLDPNIVKRGMLLPLGRTKQGEMEWAVPEILLSLARSARLPGRVAQGYPWTPKDVTEMAMNVAGTGYLGGGLLTGSVPKGAVLGANVWHGGPNRWMPEPGYPQGRPLLSRVGTGEGAQAYGHGFYSAEAKGVAQSYKDDLFQNKGLLTIRRDGKIIAQGDEIPDDVMEAYKYLEAGRDAAGQFPHNTAYYAKQMTGDKKIQRLIDKHVDDTFKYEDKPGTLKKLDLPDEDIAKFLDWDAPLSEQPASVRKALKKIIPDDDLWDEVMRGNPTGEQIHNNVLPSIGIGRQGADDLKSAALRKAGIPGLKYYDQMSRIDSKAQQLIDAQGSRKAALALAKKRLDGVGFGDVQGRAHWSDMVGRLDKPQTRNYVTWDQDVLNRTRILESGGETVGLLKKPRK